MIITTERKTKKLAEYLDIVDENGEPTGKTVDRETAHREGIRHRTAHLWLLRKAADGSIQVLLQKRCSTKSSFPGCYDISSAGHIPAGVDYIPSALRELEEELGTTAKADELIYCGTRTIRADEIFFGKEFHDRQVSKIFILWRDIDEDGFTLQRDEVDEVRWIGLDECINAVENDTIKHCIVMEELLMVKRAAEASLAE